MHKIRLFQEKQEHQMEKKKFLNSTMTTSTTMDRSQACRSLLPHPSRKHICNWLVHSKFSNSFYHHKKLQSIKNYAWIYVSLTALKETDCPR
jgi:hypothetical protein